MSKLIILLVILISCCCRDIKKPNDFAAIDNNKAELRPNLVTTDKASKLQRFKVWIDSTSILDLPFKAIFDTTTEGTFRIKFWEKDSIFRTDFKRVGDIYLMGLISDTTDFYGFVFVSITAAGNPGIVTFDKLGNKVDLKLLTKDNCIIYSGDVLLCKEYTTIGRDWSLDYYFKSIVAGEGDSMDTVCTNSISKGNINKSGEINLGQFTEINCED
ncbi:hypothetical protein SanaruYs_35620 [Chryseotalea sanaruensis]|uniref:Uncharacterized protein n=1 Tax=Chryseotalea sanaruensis TaxID=2482724 RepID=A0A401UEJ0_9BACT|nr:hypothetical protein [Chryseotalea sanaruensis]GCC53319.1 hypothetical protein SanaruYs_35620 [Chryseotalea sanaruensis]